MKKSILILLALLAFGTMTWAQANTEVEVGNATELTDAIADGAYITLTDNITLSTPLNIPNNTSVLINLNSHYLKRNLTSATSNGCIIIVAETGNLAIFSGEISGGWNSTSASAGAIMNKGTLEIHNVIISNCKGTDGGAINNTSGATLIITNCTINNCLSNAGGGGIVNKGTATLNNCTISGNTATTRGGAIWSNSSLTINGGTFNGNEALAAGEGGDGGAIHLESGMATLTNVTITNNTSKDAGGIYVKEDATLNLGGTTGSTLSGNTSSEHGGGGIVNYGTVALSGIVSITENTCHTFGGGIWSNGTLTMEGNIQVKNNTDDNIYLKSGKIINVSAPLTSGANSIGINMEVPAVFTYHYSISDTETNPFYSNRAGNVIDFCDGEAKMVYTYYECSWDSENNLVDVTLKTVPAEATVYNICTSMYASGGDLTDSRWFIADGTGSTTNGLTCGSGDRHLILCDGASITINKGFFVPEGTTLHIYSQSFEDNMGKLISNNTENEWPGIGGKEGYTGTIIIHGGDIEATGGKYAAGIGGREDRPSGTITIYNGKVTAEGGSDGAGIGGGEGGSGEDITIYGGYVTATGTGLGAGIGGGEYSGGGGKGGNISIYGGIVMAFGGHESAGIGGGSGGDYGSIIEGSSGNITIYGGYVLAQADQEMAHSAAGIGAGKHGTVGSITIHGGEIHAFGAEKAAAIGSAEGMNQGGPIVITGGWVEAIANDNVSKSGGAGIGAGSNGSAGVITISGGTVNAKGGLGRWHANNAYLGAGAGIGSGGLESSSTLYTPVTGGTITISGGAVYATGGRYIKEGTEQPNCGGAGIGCGGWANNATINITGGTIEAQGNSGGEGIGLGGSLDYEATPNLALSLYDDAKVTAGEDKASALPAVVANRKTACKLPWVKVEHCDHSQVSSADDTGFGVFIESCTFCSYSNFFLPYTFQVDGNWDDPSLWLGFIMPSDPESDVVVRAAATIPHDCTIHVDTITLQNGGSITIADGGQLIHSNEGLMASVKKCISGYGTSEGGYYLLTNPVIDAHNPVMMGMTTGNYDLYSFNQSEQLEWKNYKQTPFDLEMGTGYLYANDTDTDLSFYGIINRANANINVPVTYNANADFAGFNLIGNPFVCNAYLTDGRDFYILDDENGEEVVIATDHAIAPTQGVFVKAAANESSVSFTTTAPTKGKALNLSVTRNRGTVVDKTRIRFEEGRGLEKFQLNPNHSKLYIPMDDKDYAVVNAEPISEMPVNFKASENGTYTLSFGTEEVEFNYLHLIDNMIGNDVDLLATPSYNFEAKTTDYANRFKLVFCAKDATGSASDETFAFISNGQIIITDADANATLQIVDVTGHVIVCRDALNASLPTSGMAPGVYVLRLIDGNDVRTQKIVIE